MEQMLLDNISAGADSETIAKSRNELSMADMVERMETIRRIPEKYGLAEITEKIDIRKRDALLPVMVVVAGEGNYGKSSLLNALAGREIAPVSVIPLTWKVDVYRLSPSDHEYAQIRFVGKRDYEEVSVEEAQNLCLQEEQYIKSNPASKPRISEVIWYRTGLEIGCNICLVDTPGLEQAGLGVDITSERLVKGLGATYTVDEVWHYYYYRADVVLWTFESTKLDAKGTHDCIDRLTGLQEKRIVPVVTKTDKVPQNRWNEIAERFNNSYGRYKSCGLEQRLFCTVCGGKSNLVGTGVKELQDYIRTEIAAHAVQMKITATYDFCRDTSRELKHILQQSAQQLVENLRTMADAADEVALNLMRVGAEQRNQTSRQVNEYLSAKAKNIDSYLYPIVRNAIEHDSLYSVKSRLNEFVALRNVERMLDAQLKEISSQIQSLAVALCKQRRLHRITIGTSGRESREQFSFLIDIKEPHIPPIHISDISYSIPEIGIVDGVVRGIKSLLGMAFKMTDEENRAYQQYLKSVITRLDKIKLEAPKTFHDHIQSRISPALLEAVTASLSVSTKSSAAEIVDLLHSVDLDLRKLQCFSEDEKAAPTQFANWARYWIAESRDVELAKQLVMDILWPRLTDIQSYTSSYKELPDIKKEFQRRFKMAYRKSITIRHQANDRQKHIAGISNKVFGVVRSIMNCGGREVVATAHMNLSSILHSTSGCMLIQMVSDDFRRFMRYDPILNGMEEQIGEALPDAVVHEFVAPYSGILASRMHEALTRLESRDIDTTMPAIKVLFWMFSRSFGFAPFVLVSLSPLVGIIAGLIRSTSRFGLFCSLASLACGLVLMLISNGVFRKQMRHQTHRASLDAADKWIMSASLGVANRIDESFFKQLVDKLTMQLSPRPLQRVSLGELADVKH